MSFLGWFVGLVVSVQEFFFYLGCCSVPVQNIFFLTVHYFSALVPTAKQAGQAAVLGRLSLSVCVSGQDYPEPVFVDVYGAQESIPRNRFRQAM